MDINEKDIKELYEEQIISEKTFDSLTNFLDSKAKEGLIDKSTNILLEAKRLNIISKEEFITILHALGENGKIERRKKTFKRFPYDYVRYPFQLVALVNIIMLIIHFVLMCELLLTISAEKLQGEYIDTKAPLYFMSLTILATITLPTVLINRAYYLSNNKTKRAFYKILLITSSVLSTLTNSCLILYSIPLVILCFFYFATIPGNFPLIISLIVRLACLCALGFIIAAISTPTGQKPNFDSSNLHFEKILIITSACFFVWGIVMLCF